MRLRILLACALGAAQELRLGDVNIVVTTDVHTWFSAHAHPDTQPETDADLGDVTSFVQRLRQINPGRDIYFFDNGDVVDGTGLGAEAAFDIMKMLPYDGMNCGNHELYSSETVLESLAPFAGQVPYVTTNTLLDGAPLGRPFRIVEGNQSRLLVFGFIFNMWDHCGAVEVLDVETILESADFADALSAFHSHRCDAIIVLAHMHYADPLVGGILLKIRSVLGNVAVQFLTGHSHMRAFKQLDASSTTFEAGHYADTLGFISLSRGKDAWSFAPTYIDMTRSTLAQIVHASVVNFTTTLGASVRSAVSTARLAAGLEERLGCGRGNYRLEAALSERDSLWALYLEKIAPATITKASNAWFVASSGALRYDLYSGQITRGDVLTIVPFQDALAVVHGIDADALRNVLFQLNEGARRTMRTTLKETNATLHETRRPRFHASAKLPPYVATALASGPLDAIFGGFDAPAVVAAIRSVTGQDVVTMPFSVAAAQYTDTQAWIDWASSLPQPPCL
ncbi:Metallo-dependent phosphatase-like protein [Pelagophyceae sp. CCMP2097]|nr:Metallo-dependent phosphatase-like protein [Pelagophyceae sp. CCMP2097]